jgi:hypothetical protein
MNYYIARKRHWYNNQSSNYALGYSPVAYSSRAEALEAMHAEEREVYHLSHNESGRPTLKVVPDSQLTEGMRNDLRHAR